MSNLLVIYGGKSCEHDISVITGCLARGYFDGKIISAYLDEDNKCYLVPNNFTPKRHVNLHVKKQIVFLFGQKQIGIVQGKRLQRLDIDVVVNCCHGRCGEDGAIAALCELCGWPLVGSSVISSAVSMDKIFTKNALCALKLPVLRGIPLFVEYTPSDLNKISKLGFPVIVKPATLGSSIGISVCHTVEELKQGLDLAFRYDTRVLCEKALTNFYELNCSAMRVDGKIQTSVVESPVSSGEMLSFYDKYQRGEKFLTQNRDVSQKVYDKVVELTEIIYKTFSLQGVVRVDYLVDAEADKVYVNEINSIPGSLAYGLWQKHYSPKQFGDVLIAQAIKDFEHGEELTTHFDSGVLNGNFSKK